MAWTDFKLCYHNRFGGCSAANQGQKVAANYFLDKQQLTTFRVDNA